MDIRAEENGDLDFVQWQSSQTACAALDTLLSEATFTSPSDGFQRNKGTSYSRGDKLSKSTGHMSSPYALASSSSWSSLNGLSPSSDSTPPNTSSFTFNSKNLANDHRMRLSRSSSSSITDLSPVHDPDQFINMLKGISQRIDGNIRSDVDPFRERLKRKQQSKRVPNSSDPSIKRVKNHPSSSKPVLRSSSEGSKKGKVSSGVPTYPSGLSRSSAYTDSADVTRNIRINPPKSSYEAMPPPPVPLAKRSPLSSSSSSSSSLLETPSSCNTLQASSSSKVEKSAEPWNKDKSPFVSPQKLSTTSVADNTPSSSNSASTSTQNISLHPLLDPERKQRRLKLERTISATLASLPDEPSPTNSSSSQTTRIATPQQTKTVSVRRQIPEKTRQPVNPPSSSQGRLNGSSRPPPLGMRRTHTYPQLSQQMSQSGSLPKKTFKPPLLSTSQPTQIATQRIVRSQESPAPKNSARQSHSHEDQDEEMEDLPNSDADLSFGDAVLFDVDMDVLEETMRMYD